VLFFIFYFTVRIGTMFITDYAWLRHNLYAIHLFQVFGYIFYACFLMSFLNLKKEIGILYKILKYFNFGMIAYLFADGYLNYFSHEILLSIFAFTLVRYALLILSVATIIILFKQRKKIANYIAYGLFFLFFFGLVSLLYTPVLFNQSRFHNFFDMRILWYQVGIFIELIFFTMALQHKTNLKNKKNILYLENIKIENEKKEFESLMMVMEAKDKERTRIAQEIHDDIGSGLTNIRLLSEIAKHKNAGAELVEMDKISASASELIDNMNEIIWSINSKNDFLSNLVAYIRRFVVSYFENVDSMDVKTKIPPDIPNLQVSGDFRRSVFLVVKESLHNILKHARATRVLLEIDFSENRLFIKIQDNGVGVDQDLIRPFSNGLKNMRERVENLGGNFSLFRNNGTLVQMDLPVTLTS
jgi:signal transduction histidine kinase